MINRSLRACFLPTEKDQLWLPSALLIPYCSPPELGTQVTLLDKGPVCKLWAPVNSALAPGEAGGLRWIPHECLDLGRTGAREPSGRAVAVAPEAVPGLHGRQGGKASARGLSQARMLSG